MNTSKEEKEDEWERLSSNESSCNKFDAVNFCIDPEWETPSEIFTNIFCDSCCFNGLWSFNDIAMYGKEKFITFSSSKSDYYLPKLEDFYDQFVVKYIMEKKYKYTPLEITEFNPKYKCLANVFEDITFNDILLLGEKSVIDLAETSRQKAILRLFYQDYIIGNGLDQKRKLEKKYFDLELDQIFQKLDANLKNINTNHVYNNHVYNNHVYNDPIFSFTIKLKYPCMYHTLERSLPNLVKDHIREYIQDKDIHKLIGSSRSYSVKDGHHIYCYISSHIKHHT